MTNVTTAEYLPERWKTAAGFLTERQDFLYVYVTESAGGPGWDVVLRVDGTYADRATAEHTAEGIREWMTSLTDVGRTHRHWWSGPLSRKVNR